LKKLTGTLIALLITSIVSAQKISYKSGVINVDGNDIAKVVKIKDKENLGFTSTFELYAMSGEKLIIAVIATDFVPDRNDNSGLYYRLTFLTTNQVGIFSLSKLWTEKSFVNLIGKSGIIKDDHLDAKMVNEMLALKSKNPEVSVEYHLVKRDRRFPISLKDGGLIDQGRVIIGNFKKVASQGNLDTYEFSLPEGLVVAKVSFVGGNAKQFLITTYKDKSTANYTIDIDKQYGAMIISSIDNHEESLIRVTKWLVKREYL
jgi:hypothetical protein